MANFTKGQTVKVNTVVPSGPVEAYRMDEDGVIYCLISWIDENGAAQNRWFREDVLVAV